LTAPEVIKYKGYDKGVDHWSWGVVAYRLVTGKYPFYQKGMDELTLYKRICRGSFEVDGLMSISFRVLLVGVLYPDPDKRLGARMNGHRDIFSSPWFVHDDTFNLRNLRKQAMPAPWVPKLTSPLDASRFQQSTMSDVEDLMDTNFPSITKEQQTMFTSFGGYV